MLDCVHVQISRHKHICLRDYSHIRRYFILYGLLFHLIVSFLSCLYISMCDSEKFVVLRLLPKKAALIDVLLR